jgi:hypothetical protein
MRKGTSHGVALILAATLLVPAAGLAQSPAEDSAYAVVTKLFDAMRARDTSAMRAAFVPNASMQALRPDSVRFEAVDGWIAGIGRAPAGVLLDERLANPVVHVDGYLASIWVDYWFFMGDRFSHCGVDAVQLVRQGGQWRIFSIVDTRRTTGCAPAPPR